MPTKTSMIEAVARWWACTESYRAELAWETAIRVRLTRVRALPDSYPVGHVATLESLLAEARSATAAAEFAARRAEDCGAVGTWKRAARKAAGAGARVRVELVVGDESPRQIGTAAYWETPSGARCHYPNAYRKAYGRPVYIHSTIRVQVGAGWMP